MQLSDIVKSFEGIYACGICLYRLDHAAVRTAQYCLRAGNGISVQIKNLSEYAHRLRKIRVFLPSFNVDFIRKTGIEGQILPLLQIPDF